MSSFQCLYHQPVFQKKQLLYQNDYWLVFCGIFLPKWLLASLLWYLSEDLNLLGLFDRKVGLITKYAMAKVSENVVDDELLSQTQADTINTKNKTLVECANKNSRRLISLTNQLKNLCRAASEVFSECLSSTPIQLLLIETQLTLLKITLNFFEYQFFDLDIPTTFMLWTCSAPPPIITGSQRHCLKISNQPVKEETLLVIILLIHKRNPSILA